MKDHRNFFRTALLTHSPGPESRQIRESERERYIYIYSERKRRSRREAWRAKRNGKDRGFAMSEPKSGAIPMKLKYMPSRVSSVVDNPSVRTSGKERNRKKRSSRGRRTARIRGDGRERRRGKREKKGKEKKRFEKRRGAVVRTHKASH